MRLVLCITAVALGGCAESPRDDGPRTDGTEPTTTTPAEPRVWQSQEFAVENRATDVLVVLDNSDSMLPRQLSLPALGPALQDALDEYALDYHVGLITTDTWSAAFNGRLQGDGTHRWSTLATPSVGDSLVERMDVDPGTNITAGREAARLALDDLSQPGEYNDGFLRAEADLHLVFLSDSQDWSNGSLAPFLDALKDPGWRVVVSGITPGGEGDYRLLDEDDEGLWLDMAALPWTGIWDVLDPDDPVQQGVLALPAEPDPATLGVQEAVDGVWVDLEPGDWAWDSGTGSVLLSSSMTVPWGARYRVTWLPEVAP